MPNPNNSVFPFATPTDLTFTVASDAAQTTLSGDINQVIPTIIVNDAGNFEVPCLIVIEEEIIRVGDKSGNSFILCERGFAGTTQAIHSNNTPVYGYILAHHHNSLSAELKRLSEWNFQSGLLGIQQIENMVSRSVEFENGSWIKTSGVTVPQTTILAPDENTTARTILDGSQNGVHSISILPTGITTGGIYTFSIFAKYVDNQWISIGQNIGADLTRRAWFDIQNGSVGVIGNAVEAAIVSVGNGWYRCILKTDCTGAAYKLFDVAIAPSNGNLTYSGSATKSVDVWGAQVRRGDLTTPLTYIETTGTPFSKWKNLFFDLGSLSTGMPYQLRRGTSSENNSFTGAIGEVTIDTTVKTIRVHDGSTLGGTSMALATHTHPVATPSVNGFLSATDKAKIDNFPNAGVFYYQKVQTGNTPIAQRSALSFTTAFGISDDLAGDKSIVDLVSTGVGAGTYTKLTVDVKGRVTSATNIGASDVPTITASKISDFDTQVRTSRLDQMTAPTSNVSLNSHKITSLLDPVDPQDAATKNYVDAVATGLTVKQPCRLASLSNIILSTPGSSIDGVLCVLNDRILVKDQDSSNENGIWVWLGSSTPMARASDANTNGELVGGTFVFVTEGSQHDIGFVITTDVAINIGVTPIEWAQFSGAISITTGNGLNKTGSILSVDIKSRLAFDPIDHKLDLAVSGVSIGTYNTLTVDVYGRVTSASNTSYQPADADLTALAALSSTGFVVRTAANTFTTRTLGAGTGISISDADGIGNAPSISVSANTTNQKVAISKGGTSVGTRKEVNLIEGTGITLTVVDDNPTDRVNVTITASGSGLAPDNASYLTLGTNSGLSAERVLTQGSGVTLTDTGANGTLTVATVKDFGDLSGTGIPYQLRKGTTAEHGVFTGLNGEVTVDTTKKTLVVHDNSTLGGVPIARADHTHTLYYQTVMVNASAVTQRGNLDFAATFSVTDDSGNNKSIVDLATMGGLTPAQYGSATQVAQITVDSKGRISAVGNVTVSGVTPGGSAGGDLSGTYPSPNVNQVGGASASNVASAASLKHTQHTDTGTTSTTFWLDSANADTSKRVQFKASSGSIQTRNYADDDYTDMYVRKSCITHDIVHTGSNIGFFSHAISAQQAKMSAADSALSITATHSGPWGFSAEADWTTTQSIINNLRTRVNELETALTNYGLLSAT